MNEIIRPCENEVEKYLKKWNSLENYVFQESSLNKLFHKTYPYNSNMDDVLIKVCSLNDFYSTNIFSPFLVAKHIISLNIDDRLKKEDLALINDIARMSINGKEHIFYSFASKYCSHHYDEIYPIFDSYVEKVLKYFRNLDKFYDFRNEDLRDYKQFNLILEKFSLFYHLEKYSIKELDKYLWQFGKEYFPKKY